MKFIYNIFRFVYTPFYYLAVGWKVKNKPILLYLFLFFFCH